MLSVKEVAERLKLSEMTVRNLINRGEIKAQRFGHKYRINETDFNNYLESAKVRMEDKKNEQE